MIKLFRKTRQKLLTEHKFSKYFLYVIGEIVLVVIGILIALQLNLMNENTKLDQVRQGYYHQLLDNLNKDKIYIKKTISLLDSMRFNYKTYLETFKQPNLSPDQAIRNQFDLIPISTVISFNTSTIESLENTGDIKIIPPFIRNKLADLKQLQYRTIKASDTNDNAKNDLFVILGAEFGSSSLRGRLNNQPQLKGFLQTENKADKLFIIMEAAYEWKEVSERQTLASLKTILTYNEALVKLINVELKK
jgi:hypothetical protein